MQPMFQTQNTWVPQQGSSNSSHKMPGMMGIKIEYG
jgi:hypothetical protein